MVHTPTDKIHWAFGVIGAGIGLGLGLQYGQEIAAVGAIGVGAAGLLGGKLALNKI